MQKPLRPCAKAGCAALTREGYCQKHRPPPRRDSRSDAARERHKLYAQPVWTNRLRPAQLLRQPFCADCARHGVRTRATEVDHIVPNGGDAALFRDAENLQSLCKACHSRKTMRENKAGRSG